MKDLIYTKWEPRSEENSRQAEIYTTENKLSRWHYIGKSTLNGKGCHIKIYHSQKLYELFFVGL